MTPASPSSKPRVAPVARPKSSAKATSAKISSDAPEGALFNAFSRLRKRVMIQTWILGFFTLALTAMLPFSGPIVRYFTMTPDGKLRYLIPLDVPNMTNHAILSWATTSVTEVMTMGFGDISKRLPLQRSRFTPKGWDAFVKAYLDSKFRERFKDSQLVLTTAPADTPVIIYQGFDETKTYQWIVQVPIVMTYATNNNVTRRQRAIVTMTIVRVPAEQTFGGIAIQSWLFGS